MWRIETFSSAWRNHPLGRMAGYAQSQPSWVARTAVLVGLLVFAIPIVLLTLAAVVMGVLAFVVLGLFLRVKMALSSLFKSRSGDGRVNVRVIRRDGSDMY